MVLRCMDAWDYIEFDHEWNHFDLFRSINTGITTRLEPRKDTFPDWINDNYELNIPKYPGEFIAVIGWEVVAHAKDEKTLRDDVEKRYPLYRPWITNFPEKEESCIVSPRL